MVKKIKTKMSDIKSLWVAFMSGYRMKSFLNNMENYSKKDAEKNYVIVVQPLYSISWPLYMIALGYMLHKKGLNVAYIWDETNFENNLIYYKANVVVIKYFLSLLENKGYKVYKLPHAKSASSSAMSIEYLSNLADMQSVWLTRGETSKDRRQIIRTRYLSNLNKASMGLEVLFQSINCNRIIVAGGLISTANLYLKYATSKNISISTVDCGAGRSLVSNSGVAAHLSDIPIAFKLIDVKDRDLIRKLSFEYLNKRINGTDNFQYQSKHIDSINTSNVDVLLLLNSVWDQAALGLHTIYSSTNEWITDTVEWILNNTKASIVVRQHPAEKNKDASTNDNYDKLLENFMGNKRFTFISAWNEENTYGLIQKSKVVVCYSTTTALEAIMIGKPVITVSNCYYSEQKFAFKPSSLDNYYNLISRGLSQQLILREEDIDDAAIFYYLSQLCNWIFTDFNAAGFDKWVHLDSVQINKLPGVDSMLTSLSDELPHAIVKHINIMLEYKKKKDSSRRDNKKG